MPEEASSTPPPPSAEEKASTPAWQPGKGGASEPFGMVLVVEDLGSIRRLLVKLVQAGNYEVREAEDGRTALRLAESRPPDAVLLDMMMPGMDGITMLRALKEKPGLDKVPVIMCTAKAQRDDVIEALQAGAVDYIVKPFRKETVLEKLDKVLGVDREKGTRTPPAG